MDKKRALITGANRGIGLALTQCLVDREYLVDCVCRSSSEALEALPVRVHASIDLTQSEDLYAFQQTVSEYRYDLIINDAGMLTNETVFQFDRRAKDRVLDQFKLNSLAPLELSSLFIPQLKRPSKLVFITSRMGSIDDNTSGSRYGYRMSKVALNMMAKSMAIDLSSKEISVGVFHPGYVKTGMTQYTGHVEPKTSATQLFERIDDLSLKTSGCFFHAKGDPLPW